MHNCWRSTCSHKFVSRGRAQATPLLASHSMATVRFQQAKHITTLRRARIPRSRNISLQETDPIDPIVNVHASTATHVLTTRMAGSTLLMTPQTGSVPFRSSIKRRRKISQGHNTRLLQQQRALVVLHPSRKTSSWPTGSDRLGKVR